MKFYIMPLLSLCLLLCLPFKIQSKQQTTIAQVKDSLAIAYDLYHKGIALDNEGKVEEGNLTVQEALKLATSVKNYALMARAMNFLAINLSGEGKRDEGITLAYHAFDAFMLAGDTVRASNVKINIGMDYNNQGKYEQALTVELEALGLRLQCGDSTNLAAYYQRIGEVYKDLGIREKWKSNLETAHHLAKNSKYASFNTQMGILNDYGGIYEAEHQYEKAETVYLEMYSKSKEANYLNGMATASTNLLPVYRNMGKIEKALECSKEALELQSKRENDYGKLTVYNQMGEIYYQMGNPELAKINFLLGLKLSKKLDYINDQKESLHGLYLVNRSKNHWKEALLYHEQWNRLKDSLQNIDLKEKITEIETKYQTERKEQQIEVLNSENKLKGIQIQYQNLTIWGGGLLFLIIALSAFFGIRQKGKQQQMKQNELEQKLLRSQLNPHFIFNSLGAIQHFMMKNEGRQAAFYLSSFASLMRSILKNSRKELIALEEEKQTLENYLNLHQLRLGDKLAFKITVADHLDTAEILMPPMLIQPFVENAIIHGVERSEEKGNVDVTFSRKGDNLVITIEDNGKGITAISEHTEKTHDSFALQIFKERINNLKRSAGIDITLAISNRSNNYGEYPGTMVIVQLPILSEKNYN